MIFYQGEKFYHGTHILRPVSQSNVESEYNEACNVRITLETFRMLINEFLNKDPDIVPE